MATVGTATHTIIAEAVVQRIQDLDLSGIPDSDIAVRVFDEDLARLLPGPPGVMVLPIGRERVSHLEGENNSVIIGYPVLVVIGASMDGVDLEVIRNIDGQLKPREDIRNALWHEAAALRDAGAPITVWDIEWEPNSNFIPKAWQARNMWLQSMLFRVTSKEPI